MDPESDQLKPPSAGMGFETPGQQCHLILATGQTTADDCLLVDVGWKLGGNTFSSTERIDTRADSKVTTPSTASNTVSRQDAKSNDKTTSREENKQFDPVEKDGSHRLGKRVYRYCFFSWGESGHGCPLLVLCAFSACQSVCCVLFLTVR